MANPIIGIKYSQFFDRKTVIDAVESAERKQLSKAGAFVRIRARRSIRKRKSVSKPGKPPTSQTGEYRRTILFGYDRRAGSVVIGPSANFGGSGVPSLLEFGGTARRRGRRVRYLPRPHMRPALEAEAPKFPSLFKNAVR